MYLSVTRLRLHGPLHLAAFLRRNAPAARQARGAPGIIEARFTYRFPLMFCTMTLWRDRGAMLDYRNSGAHLDAMRAIRSIGTGEVVGCEADRMPSWGEALAMLDRGTPGGEPRHE